MRNRNQANADKRIVVQSNVEYQLAEDTTEVVENDSDEKKVSWTKVKDNVTGEVRRDIFGITVKGKKKNEETKKMEDVVLYENDEEPFEYDFCSSLPNCLIHAGAKLSEDQVDFLGTALKVTDESEEGKARDKSIGEAVAKFQKIYNSKLKSDAKSNAYQGLVNKHKPLEGEDREVAIAKTIRGIVKLSGVSVEIVIGMLKEKNAVPADYTVEDYNATKMRKTKGDDDEE